VGDGAYLEDCIVGHALQQPRHYDVRPGETIRGGALFRAPTERRGSR
jgi:mannose-1-phosphate guanylyltransferase